MTRSIADLDAVANIDIRAFGAIGSGQRLRDRPCVANRMIPIPTMQAALKMIVIYSHVHALLRWSHRVLSENPRRALDLSGGFVIPLGVAEADLREGKGPTVGSLRCVGSVIRRLLCCWSPCSFGLSILPRCGKHKVLSDSGAATWKRHIEVGRLSRALCCS